MPSLDAGLCNVSEHTGRWRTEPGRGAESLD